MTLAPDAQTVRTIGAGRHPVWGGVWLTAQFLALNAIGLFSTAYIIRGLGAEQYGQWATAAALASAHQLVTNVGLRPIFVRNIARHPERADDLLAEQLGMRMVLGALAAVFAMIVCVLLRYPPVVLACMAIGCVWIMLSVISSTLGDVLQALEKFGSYAAIALISGLAVTAVSVVAVYQGCGPIGLTVAYLATPAVNVWLQWRIARRHVRVRVRWRPARMRALLRESRVVGASQVAAAVRDRAEPLLVPRIAGLEAFGIFSAGTIVADRLGNVPDAICTAFYPRISRAAEGRSSPALERTVTSMLTIGLAASVPLAVVGAYLAQSISEILLPTSSETCRRVIEISVWTVPLLAMSLGMSFSLQAAGHHDLVARFGLRATVISAALSIALIASAGITGATWSLLARPGIVAVTLLPSFRRTFPSALAHVPFARIFLSAAALASIWLLADRDHIWPAVASAVVGMGAYGAALLACRVFPLSAVARLFSVSLAPALTVRPDES
jgi:O-antigen/teichoic acid export membrane protein